MGNSKTRANQSIVVKQEATQRNINVAHVSAIGIDVHLDLLVCAYQTSTEGEIITEVRNFGTSYSQLKSFASWCAERQPEIVSWSPPMSCGSHHTPPWKLTASLAIAWLWSMPEMSRQQWDARLTERTQFDWPNSHEWGEYGNHLFPNLFFVKCACWPDYSRKLRAIWHESPIVIRSY